MTVFRGNQKGYVIDYNKYEAQVQWEDEFGHRQVQNPLRINDFENIRFSYDEDAKFILGLLRKGK